MESETRIVTPQMASLWLGDNPHNRPINQKRVMELVKKIQAGSWKENPPIEVFSTGRLWNGQHRLTAIVRSGVSVPLRVCVRKKGVNHGL